MTYIDSHNGDDASLALATYLEPLVRGRRVLLVASPESVLSAHLASVAEAVQVVPGEELSIVGSHADAELELVFDEDGFDLIWVMDVADLPDPRARAADAFRNALALDGAIVLCGKVGAETKPRRRRSRGGGGRPTDPLRKLAGQVCEEVLMLTQTRFDGFAIDAPDAPDGGTALDQTLTRGHSFEPLWHVAVAADRLPDLEARLVVRVEGGDPSTAVQADPAQIAELEERLEALGSQADGLRAEAADLDEALELALARAEKAEEVSRAAEGELGELTRRRRQDRDDLDRARGKIRVLERSLEEAREAAADPEELEALRQEASELEERLVEVGARVVDLESEVERRGEIARDLMIDLERAREEASAATAAVPQDSAQPSDGEILVAAGLPGSSLLGRDSERVRAMGAELLTYRQHASERDALEAQLAAALDALRTEKARGLGLSMRLEEAERALERVDADGASSEEVTDLHVARDDSEARARELSASLADAHARVADLQREASDAVQRGEGSEDGPERDAIARQLEEAQQKAADLEQALRESDDELEALRADLRSREQSLDKTRRERDEARNGLAEARALLQQVASLQQEPPAS